METKKGEAYQAWEMRVLPGKYMSASFTMEEVLKGRRDPDEGVVVQQLAMSADPGKQVVR